MNQGRRRAPAARHLRAGARHPLARAVFLGSIAAILVAALVAGGYLVNLAVTFNNNARKIETAFPEDKDRPSIPPTEDRPLNILLLGTDARPTDDTVAGGSVEQNSDTMMLVHIPRDRRNVYIMSVVRDMWVDIPGSGPAKINAAMGLGGIPLVVQTFESLFDARIDHVMTVDFEGFKDLTDALGGVEIDNPAQFTTVAFRGVCFPAGPQVLDGKRALIYVRERKAFSDGDYTRVKNQQRFVKALMGTLLDRDTLTDPIKIQNAVAEFSPYLGVDETLDATRLASIALALRDVRVSDIQMFTLPTAGSGTSPDGLSIELTDTEVVAGMSGALRRDSLGTYLASIQERIGGTSAVTPGATPAPTRSSAPATPKPTLSRKPAPRNPSC